MPLSTRVSGAWKSLSTVSVNVNGVWKSCNQVYVKVNGAWKSCDISPFIFTINTAASTSGEKKGAIPFQLTGSAAVLSVDWGDGSFSTLKSSNYSSSSDYNASIHTYSTAGTYTIKIFCTDWSKISNTNVCTSVGGSETSRYYFERTLTAINSPFPNISSTSAFALFRFCSKLKTIPSNLFQKYTNCTSFYVCFDGCSSLQSIPSGLFDKNTATTSFDGCFSGCSSLTSIPSGLFDKNTAVDSFYATFFNCTSLTSIPTGLFDKNTKVERFVQCFFGCSKLASIPSGLFDKNINVVTFETCFYNCTSLTSIPTNLFKYNTKVTVMVGTFEKCSALGNFTIHIGSSIIGNGYHDDWDTLVDDFVTKKSGTTRKVYVPKNSTTHTEFNAVASKLGLTIIGE